VHRLKAIDLGEEERTRKIPVGKTGKGKMV
jgi:hypothetical protein